MNATAANNDQVIIKIKMGCMVVIPGQACWLASNVPADVLASLSAKDRARVARAVRAETMPAQRYSPRQSAACGDVAIFR